MASMTVSFQAPIRALVPPRRPAGGARCKAVARRLTVTYSHRDRSRETGKSGAGTTTGATLPPQLPPPHRTSTPPTTTLDASAPSPAVASGAIHPNPLPATAAAAAVAAVAVFSITAPAAMAGEGALGGSALDSLKSLVETLEALPTLETAPIWLAVLTASEMVPLLPTLPVALTSGILFGKANRITLSCATNLFCHNFIPRHQIVAKRG
jgi:hypothetical protein